MIIEYTLPQKTSTTNIYFTRYVTAHLKKDCLRALNKKKIKIRLKYIENNGLIKWQSFSRNSAINVDKFLQEVANSLEFKRFKNNYIIRINPLKLFPGTLTSIYFLVRLVDKGDNNISGCYEFSKLFLKYQKNIYRYYRSFCLLKQFKISEVDNYARKR